MSNDSWEVLGEVEIRIFLPGEKEPAHAATLASEILYIPHHSGTLEQKTILHPFRFEGIVTVFLPININETNH